MPMTRHGKLFGSRGPPPLRAIQLYSIHRRRLGVGSAQGALRRGGRALSCFNTMYGILGFTRPPLSLKRSCLNIKSSCRCRESQNNLSRLGLGLCTLTRTWTRKYRGFTFSVHTRLRRPDCTVQNEMLAR